MNCGLKWLFVDLNSYFASVEQELCPELRGRPVAIVPVVAESTCCIAVSYQAKAYGIQSGMSVADAKLLCPHLLLVHARHRIYVEFHEHIRSCIERCIPIQEVMSCDEFVCQLIGRERHPLRAVEIAYAIKSELRKVGSTLRCSIGIGPNRLLAKMGAGVQKPDGLILFEQETLPAALYAFSLRDIPGIGDRMEKRLHAAGITNIRQLCALSRHRMHNIWGSVLGDRLWLWLRGEDFLEPPVQNVQTLSRQHILPPHCREFHRARAIAIKLLHSAARRMRQKQLWARSIFLCVGFAGRRQALQAAIHFEPTHSPAILQAHLTELWNEAPADWQPTDLTVYLSDLIADPFHGLFIHKIDAKERVTPIIDHINDRYGLNTIYLGSIHDVRNEAPTRITFGPPPQLSEFEDMKASK